MAVLEKTAPKTRWTQRGMSEIEPLQGAFFWLSAFYIVYCARPEDWIPGLKYVPLAKISGIFAVLGLAMSAGKAKRSLRNLPREQWQRRYRNGQTHVSAGAGYARGCHTTVD